MAFWLVKSEPGAYSWETLVREGRTHWDGVRNFQARNNMNTMKTGDQVFFYHSVKEKRIMGIAEVTREAYPDHTFTPPPGKKNPWTMVDMVPVAPLKKPVTLEQIKNNPNLSEIPLIRQSRLSVMPLTAKEWDTLLRMAG